MTGRPGEDSDMAACILFLAGPGGLFLNSQILYPDGGKYDLITVDDIRLFFPGNILVQPAAV